MADLKRICLSYLIEYVGVETETEAGAEKSAGCSAGLDSSKVLKWKPWCNVDHVTE